MRQHFLIMCCLAGYLNCDCGPDKPFRIHVSEWLDSKLSECNDSIYSVFAYMFPDERYIAYLKGKTQYLYPCFRREIRCLPEWKIQAVLSYCVLFGRVPQLWLRPRQTLSHTCFRSYLNAIIQYLHTCFQMTDTLLTWTKRLSVCAYVAEEKYFVYQNQTFRQYLQTCSDGMTRFGILYVFVKSIWLKIVSLFILCSL